MSLTDAPDAADEVDGEDPSVGSQLRNSRWGLVSRAAIAGGALTLIALLSLTLEVEQFGRFAGVSALVAILGGVARLGASELMLEALARDPDCGRSAYGRALGTIGVATLVGLAAMLALRPVLLPSIGLTLVVTLSLGEFLHVAGMDTAMRLLHATKRFRRAAIVAVVCTAIRLASVASVLVWPLVDLDDLGRRFLIAGAAVMLVGSTLAAGVVGRPSLSIPATIGELRRGLSIAVGQTSLVVSTRIDQTLLLRAGLDAQAGIYSLGARVVFNAMMPAQAVLETVYPDFFRAGARGEGRAQAMARRLLKPLGLYGLVAAAGLLVIGPILEWLLDDGFEGVRWVIVAMAGFPVIRIAQSLAGDVLSGLGAHATRSRWTIVAGVFNIVLNLLLIPTLGWKGAAISTYAADIALLVLFASSARRLQVPVSSP